MKRQEPVDRGLRILAYLITTEVRRKQDQKTNGSPQVTAERHGDERVQLPNVRGAKRSSDRQESEAVRGL